MSHSIDTCLQNDNLVANFGTIQSFAMLCSPAIVILEHQLTVICLELLNTDLMGSIIFDNLKSKINLLQLRKNVIFAGNLIHCYVMQ